MKKVGGRGDMIIDVICGCLRALESRSDLLGMGVEVDCGKEPHLRRY